MREEDVDERFQAAADYVAAAVSSGSSLFNDATKLKLYGFYKQATVGPCNTKQPGFFDWSGKAKWDAWNKLASMPKEEAMQCYVQLVVQTDPKWKPHEDDDAAATTSGQKRGGMGPVFSAFAAAEGDEGGDAAAGGATIHELAGKGDTSAVSKLLSQGGDINERDDAGCTALHFAADRGQLDMAQLLLAAGADVNPVDEAGQTPLHYAALCGQEQVCKLLLDKGADPALKDEDGATAADLGPSSWSMWPNR